MRSFSKGDIPLRSRRRRIATEAQPVLFILLWSSGAIATPFGLDRVSPQVFLAVRAAGCAVLAWWIWTRLRDPLPVGNRQWAHTTATAILMQVGYQGCFFLALDHGMTPGMLALIVSAQPLLTAALIGKVHPTTWMALTVGLIGVAIAVVSDLQATTPTAVALAVAALAAITAGTLVQGNNRTSGIWANLAIQSTISAGLFIALLPVLGMGRWHPDWQFAASAAWMILAVSVGATALLYTMVIRHDAVTVTSLFFLVPATTAILDYLVNGTRLTMPVMAGFGLTILALIAAQRTQRDT